MDLLIPERGTLINVDPSHFTTLKTTDPVIRIVEHNGSWMPVPPEEKRGLIVFVRHPRETIPKIRTVEIISIVGRVAFAICKNNP